MHVPPAPEPRELLPPLLACLPTAFMSPQPPPALLPMLSPILRQRIQYMAPNAARGESWLPLLQWDQEIAAKLPDIVERIQPEPHPVSGELELEEIPPAKYRRLDEETLQARLLVEQYEILPIYVWCENDEHGQTGAGWKLSELRSLEDIVDGTQWFDSVSAANDAAEKAANTHSIEVPQPSSNGVYSSRQTAGQEAEDDDGSYWAAYDATPANGQSPAPPEDQQPPAASAAEADKNYYERYGSVQPAMDGHDPDEEMPGMDNGTLNGTALHAQQQPPPRIQTSSIPQQRSMFPADAPKGHDSALATSMDDISHPRPISPTTSHSSVDKLEEAAAAYGYGSRDDDRAQLGIKQHISTDIKSLFRLARSAGMRRDEFDEFVRRELDVLSMLEQAG